MKQVPFFPADILLPRVDPKKWSVVACDQFTSQPEYWESAERIVGDAPSTLRLILPEVYLTADNTVRIAQINGHMREYLQNGVFDVHPNAMIYVERTLPRGGIRRGIVGAVDLKEYDFRPEKKALIRATEGTVLERIPPRVAIRRDAPLELPHVMLLIDDPQKTVIEPLSAQCSETVYDFDLMLGGGHLRGALVPQAVQARVLSALQNLMGDGEDPFLFAVGDGNHSLATAKACYDADPTESKRYALVEVVNVHDPALEFEPIYRLLQNTDANDVMRAAQEAFGGGARRVEVICGGESRTFGFDGFPTEKVQAFIDDYRCTHPQTEVDYIHGEEVLRRLAQREGCVGFLFDGMEKSELFPVVARSGVLPRKTFSMGEAESKRYYMEARRIQNG